MDVKQTDTWLAKFENHEARGLPAGAGADGPRGFPLARMRSLLASLGDPQAALRVIHVAGSKGKGSVCALVAACFRAAGYTACVYSSPHASHVRERVGLRSPGGRSGRRRGGFASESDWAATVNRHREAIDALHAATPLTHFEVTTALAFARFAAAAPDVAVVEVGLGGSRDATNVFSSSNVESAVITTIDAEHLDALGGSLEAVAAAKAGIMRRVAPRVCLPCLTSSDSESTAAARRRGRPVVVAPQPHAVAEAVLRVCSASAGATYISAPDMVTLVVPAYQPLRHLGGAWRGCTATLTSPMWDGVDASPSLRSHGPHSLTNALVAAAVAAALHGRERTRPPGLHPPPDAHSPPPPPPPLLLPPQRADVWHLPSVAIERGLSSPPLPGRLSVLRKGRRVLVADGAHSPLAAAALAAALATDGGLARAGGGGGGGGARLAAGLTQQEDAQPPPRWALVVAMASDKDAEAVLRPLAGRAAPSPPPAAPPPPHEAARAASPPPFPPPPPPPPPPLLSRPVAVFATVSPVGGAVHRCAQPQALLRAWETVAAAAAAEATAAAADVATDATAVDATVAANDDSVAAAPDAAASRAGTSTRVASSIRDALRAASAAAGPTGTVVVAGSLHAAWAAIVIARGDGWRDDNGGGGGGGGSGGGGSGGHLRDRGRAVPVRVLGVPPARVRPVGRGRGAGRTNET